MDSTDYAVGLGGQIFQGEQSTSPHIPSLCDKSRKKSVSGSHGNNEAKAFSQHFAFCGKLEKDFAHICVSHCLTAYIAVRYNYIVVRYIAAE